MTDARKTTFLGRWFRRLLVLVFLLAISLVSMYSGKIERYPWHWTREDLSGFADYCLLKYREAESGTRELIARFEDSELAADLDGMYQRLRDKMRREDPADEPEVPSDEPLREEEESPLPLDPRETSTPPTPETSTPPATEPRREVPAEPAKQAPPPVKTPLADRPAEPPPRAPEARPPAQEPLLSEAETLWMEGYELKQKGNRAAGSEKEQFFRQAVEVWKNRARPALEAEIEAAESRGDDRRARELTELAKSLNVYLHDIFKDTVVKPGG